MADEGLNLNKPELKQKSPLIAGFLFSIHQYRPRLLGRKRLHPIFAEANHPALAFIP